MSVTTFVPGSVVPVHGWSVGVLSELVAEARSTGSHVWRNATSLASAMRDWIGFCAFRIRITAAERVAMMTPRIETPISSSTRLKPSSRRRLGTECAWVDIVLHHLELTDGAAVRGRDAEGDLLQRP